MIRIERSEPPDRIERSESTWRWLTGVLLAVAGAGAVVTAADGSVVGRVAGVFAAALLGLVAVNVVRQQVWAYGSAFMLGLCWLWAVSALLVAGSLRTFEFLLWLAWSLVVMVASVRSRTPDARPGWSEATPPEGWSEATPKEGLHPKG